MFQTILAALRRLQTHLAVAGKGRFLTAGAGLHVGRGTRLWAPTSLRIGRCVYVGKQVHIEANADIGDYCLIANRVAYRVAVPVRKIHLNAVGCLVTGIVPSHSFGSDARQQCWRAFGRFDGLGNSRRRDSKLARQALGVRLRRTRCQTQII